MKRCRNWVLTQNLMQDDISQEEFKKQIEELTHLRYGVFQLEQGENGNNHYQVYLEFTQGKRFEYIKERFPTAHIETRKGTRKQAREYCMKIDTQLSPPVEIGEWKEEQGKRTDLQDIYEKIKDGWTDAELLEEYPSQFILYQDKIKSTREVYIKDKYSQTFRDLRVIYLWGSAGIGKTRAIMEHYGYSNVYRVTNYDSGSFDGYQHQDVIIFEEFRGQITLDKMLNYLDGYPLELPARFSNKIACYTKVFIVSNENFEILYPNVRQDKPLTYKAFERRIHNYYCMDDLINNDSVSLLFEDKLLF